MKPVEPACLADTIARLQQRLAAAEPATNTHASEGEDLFTRLRFTLLHEAGGLYLSNLWVT